MTTSTRRSRHEAAMVVVLCVSALAQAPAAVRQNAFSRHDLEARTPTARTVSYRVNGRVRPLLVWIGRDDIGEAFLSWRRSEQGRRGFELLIGSDPARAPRGINRWGFIVEELYNGEATVLGLMKESREQTLDEAEAKVARKERVSVFKAARTTITRERAENGTMTISAPAHLTYRDVDALLELMADQPVHTRSTDIPPGTHAGFLTAMDSLIRASLEPCGHVDSVDTTSLATVPYLYNHTLYDLTLVSCTFEPQLHTRLGVIADVVDGRFRLRNRATKSDTRFRVTYGASGEFRELPLRAVFRPRWWVEVEMEIDSVSGKDRRQSTAGVVSSKDGL